ncbi:MAG: hypothetical protein KKH98_12360 [Spirochaetes bacterium]|nr:hypothetical protein [Spirochaetota bacterium]
MNIKRIIIILFCLLILFLGNTIADLVIDDFEPGVIWPPVVGNGTNNLGYWTGGGTDSSNTVWVWADAGDSGFVKNGTGGFLIAGSNVHAPIDRHCTFFTEITNAVTNAAHYYKGRNLSNNSTYNRLEFWIKETNNSQYPGPMSIDKVKLECFWENNGWVYFKNYNGGTNLVQPGWNLISIPLADFTNIENNFSITSVAAISIHYDAGGIGRFAIDDIKIVSSIDALNISSMGTYNNNYLTDSDNTYLEGTPVYVWINELNNTTGATGHLDVRPTGVTGVTNINMNEAGGGKYFYIWDTTGRTNGAYGLETRLEKAGKTNDMDGFNNSGTDLIVNIINTLKISSINSEVGTDDDDQYNIGDTVKISIRENNYLVGADAKITITSAGADIVKDANMIGVAGGIYSYSWDTTGLTPGTFLVETSITNPSHPAHVPDKNGYIDTGTDLTITLTGNSSTGEKIVLWNNYPKAGEAVKIYINPSDPTASANEEVSVKVYTLSGQYITEIAKGPYSSLAQPILWYGDKAGTQLPDGTYVIYIKGAGIDGYKNVYFRR